MKTREIARAAVLVAMAVALSPLFIPVGVSKCYPAQHMINVIAAVVLGPVNAVIIAFLAALIRNLLSIYRRDAADPFLSKAVEQLYDSALLLDGYLSDPHQMVARINDLLADASALHAK